MLTGTEKRSGSTATRESLPERITAEAPRDKCPPYIVLDGQVKDRSTHGDLPTTRIDASVPAVSAPLPWLSCRHRPILHPPPPLYDTIDQGPR